VIERLTAGQRATFRRAYRDAYAESDNYARLDALYTKYEDLYGVSRDALLEIVTEDHRRNREHYLALHAVRGLAKKQRRKAYQEQQQKARLERTKSEKNATKAKLERTKSEKNAATAKRRAELEHKREADRKRAITNPGYYTQATYCPMCRRGFESEFMPSHEDRRNHRCQGSGRFGVTKAALERKRREDSKADRGNSVRTVSGGLPTLGKGRR
jgi:hypothetical protein